MDSDHYFAEDTYSDYSNYSYDNDDDLRDIAVKDRGQRSYTVLSEADIRQRLEDGIEDVVAVLSVSEGTACVLLRQYNWDVAKAHDEWFANEDEVRQSVGLSDKESFNVVIGSAAGGSLNDGDKLICKICYESLTKDGFLWVGCGRPFCKLCWSRYVTISIDDGPGCLALTCPEPSCRVVVDPDMVRSLVSDDYGDKYNRYLLRSYVERSRTIKWCPAPGCEYAVEFVAGGDGGSVDMFDVLCDCLYQFCWNCSEEAHGPVSCETVRKWMIKNSSEGKNMNWILANSKPCPECKTPIQKNQGCMHMTCRPPCEYEFCWLCLGPWWSHAEDNYYSCNVYKKTRREGGYNEEERRRDMAKSMVEKYAHYYERWKSNRSSREKAIADLNCMQTENFKRISDLYKTTESQLKFIMDAWFQIVEGRRVLKWTYAYGYYIPEDKKAEKSLFEYLQGQAESALERLHKCVEKELRPFFHGVDSPLNGFQDFSTKLIDLTVVTKNYFANLNRAFANDLADICFDGNKVGGGDR